LEIDLSCKKSKSFAGRSTIAFSHRKITRQNSPRPV
jgi:hypothetical protein